MYIEFQIYKDLWPDGNSQTMLFISITSLSYKNKYHSLLKSTIQIIVAQV